MTNWFIQRAENDDLGPYRPSELLDLVRSGDVTPETMLRKDDSGYFAASDVGGLFEAAMRPTIRYFCPQCENEVSEPPVRCPKCDREIRRALTQITENTIVNRTDGSSGVSNSMKNWLKKKRINKN